jgi:glycine dehydrogenase subunit 2
MAMNKQGRATAPGSSEAAAAATFTGNRGLDHEEPLIFERGSRGKTGVDLPEPKHARTRLGGLERRTPSGLPGLTEPEALRHYVRLSHRNFAIDSGLYPLGSCTMKHNARLNEKMARLPGFADIHPLQPQQTVQGAIALMQILSGYLLELTGMKAVALSPKAGAHGELCGMLAIKAAHGRPAPGAASCWCPNRRTAPTRRRRPSWATGSSRSPPARTAPCRPRRCAPPSGPRSPPSC